MSKVSVSWSTTRVGNEGWVREFRSDGTHTDFGPMPSHIVPAFITGRRIIVQRIIELKGGKKVSDLELPDEFTNPRNFN